MKREELFNPKKLLEVRKYVLKMTQAEVAKLLGITEHKIRDAEKGRSISQALANKLADFYIIAFELKKKYEYTPKSIWWGLAK